MKKEDKVLNIEKLENLLGEYAHFYVTNIAGLDAEKTSALRRECSSREVKLVMVKNNLFKKALANKGVIVRLSLRLSRHILQSCSATLAMFQLS